MRKKVIIISVSLVALLLVGVGVIYFLSNRQETSVTLTLEDGTVSYKRPTDQDYQLLSDAEVSLPTGSFIKTDAASYARIFFPDNSIVSVDEKTEIQVSYATSKIDIQQLIGKTWNRVETVAAGGSYTVQTPNTIAAVRGTIFGVGVDDKENSRVFVEESNVDINKYTQANGEIKTVENLNLTADEMANINSKLPSAKQKILATIKESFWYKRNKVVDEEYLKLKGKLRGAELRKKLREVLQNRAENDNYHFVGLVIRADQAKERLQDIYDLLNISERTCQTYSLDKIQAAIDKLHLYSRFIARNDKLEEILRNIKSACTDGEMTVDEATKLEQLVQKFNQ